MIWLIIHIRESKTCESHGVGLFVYIASDICSFVGTIVIRESKKCGNQGVCLFVHIAIEIHKMVVVMQTLVSASVFVS